MKIILGALLLVLAFGPEEELKKRTDFGILVSPMKGNWELKGEDGKHYVLGLPTKNRKPPNDPPEKDAPIDPKWEKICRENLGKRVRVISLAGGLRLGKLTLLLTLEVHPAPKKD